MRKNSIAQSQGGKLVEKLASARAQALYTIFADGDTAEDPLALSETMHNATVCMAGQIGALSTACASAISGNVGLTNDVAAQCFYGIAHMCNLLDAMIDVERNAMYQCIKRHEEQSHG